MPDRLEPVKLTVKLKKKLKKLSYFNQHCLLCTINHALKREHLHIFQRLHPMIFFFLKTSNVTCMTISTDALFFCMYKADDKYC